MSALDRLCERQAKVTQQQIILLRNMQYTYCTFLVIPELDEPERAFAFGARALHPGPRGDEQLRFTIHTSRH
jgi:hypothetical protein